jgi:hypothetical protein
LTLLDKIPRPVTQAFRVEDQLENHRTALANEEENTISMTPGEQAASRRSLTDQPQLEDLA